MKKNPLLQSLERLRARALRLLVIRRCSTGIAALVLVLLLMVVMDMLLRLPGPVRLASLLLLVFSVAAGAWRYLLPAFLARPSLTAIALRLESHEESLAGQLASSVEFIRGGDDQENPLAGQLVSDTMRRAASVRLDTCLRRGRVARDCGLCTILVGICALLGAGNPGMTGTGLRRVFLPLGAAAWPARTAVASRMDEVLRGLPVYPHGQVLALRAENMTSNLPGGHVDAFYRQVTDEVRGPWQRLFLAHQGGGIHEQLVDTEDAGAIEVYFKTEDARTAMERILLVPPPEVQSAVLSVEPPAYAERILVRREVDMGPGYDERARLGDSILAGSSVDLSLQFVPPLPVPSTPTTGMPFMVEWSSTGPRPEIVLAEDGSGCHLRWTLLDTASIVLRLEDEHGLVNPRAIMYIIPAHEDALPSATMVQPDIDRTALPGATIEVSAEGTDDVGLHYLAITSRLQRGGIGDEEPAGLTLGNDVTGTTATVGGEMALAQTGAQPGDVVLIVAEARDGYLQDGVVHPPEYSRVRRIRIISETEYMDGIRSLLGSVRQQAIRLEEDQARLQEDVQDGLPTGPLRDEQVSVAGRITGYQETLSGIARDIQENALENTALDRLLEQSGDLLDHALQASRAAADALERGARGTSEEADEAPSTRENDGNNGIARAHQKRVREELSDLIALLDRDEDSWVVRRRLESIQGTQLDLEARTSDVSREVLGLTREELDTGQRAELQEIASQQRTLRDDAEELLQEMTRRSESLEEFDPGAAAGMRRARDEGERMSLAGDMEESAQRVATNSLQGASAAQQSALRTIAQMLDEMEESDRARAEELLRMLDSMIQSIDRLIRDQERELMVLAASALSGMFNGRDMAMIRILHNTRALAVDTRQAGQEARRVARALDRAASSQSDAVNGFRAPPLIIAAVRRDEEWSLAYLQRARDLAEALQEETAADQARAMREELVEAYRALAEQQASVSEQTRTLAALEEMTRRAMMESRTLGSRQEKIRAGLRDIESSSDDIRSSAVFSLAHQLMDQWAHEASTTLWDTGPDQRAMDRQALVLEGIIGQIRAIEEQDDTDSGFVEDQAAGGGGGGGAQPVLPPVAELRLLYGLQEQVYRRTMLAHDREPGPRQDTEAILRELGDLQRRLIEIGHTMAEEYGLSSGQENTHGEDQ